AIAPEHLEIETRDADALAARVRNAGAIFLGHHTPEAIGDYVAGSDHRLPAARSGPFSSRLGLLRLPEGPSLPQPLPRALAHAGAAKRGRAAIALGGAEGLDANARSVAMRLNPR